MNINSLNQVSTKIYSWQIELCMVFFLVFLKFSTMIMDYLYNVLVKGHDILFRRIKTLKYLNINIYSNLFVSKISSWKKRMHYNKSQEKALCCIGGAVINEDFLSYCMDSPQGIIEIQISVKV